MDISAVGELIKMMENSSLSFLEYQEGEFRVVLKKGFGTDAPEACAPFPRREEPGALQKAVLETEHEIVAVTAPLVGSVYRAREKGQNPFVEIGQEVAEGDVLCLIEAMKLFSEIKAPCRGVIREILFSDGALAEFGAPLFTIGKSPC